jgi:hypothetical protein
LQTEEVVVWHISIHATLVEVHTHSGLVGYLRPHAPLSSRCTTTCWVSLTSEDINCFHRACCCVVLLYHEPHLTVLSQMELSITKLRPGQTEEPDEEEKDGAAMDPAIWGKLHGELVDRILLCLPISNLFYLRCVSKSWDDTIRSSSFNRMYLATTSRGPSWLFMCSSFNCRYCPCSALHICTFEPLLLCTLRKCSLSCGFEC